MHIDLYIHAGLEANLLDSDFVGVEGPEARVGRRAHQPQPLLSTPLPARRNRCLLQNATN